MIMTYKPREMARRRLATVDVLTSEDRLMAGLGAIIVRKLTSYPNPFGPPVHSAPSRALLDYYQRKKEAIRAAHFRVRYGRDYWTGASRHRRTD